MNCTKCGHKDALTLFSSVLCVNSTCDFYNEDYSIEKGYSKDEPGDVGPSSAAEVIGETGTTLSVRKTGGSFSIIIADEHCRRTGNPCGSDTWVIGIPCDCKSCQKWLLVNKNPWGKLELGQLDFSDYLYDWNNPYTWTVDNIPTWPGNITTTRDWIYYPSTTIDFSNISLTSDCTITFNIV